MKEASDMSVQEIYNGAMAGFEHLSNLQPQLCKFESNLFQSPHLSKERELLTEEENKEIDILIGEYLRLIAPYTLLLPAAATLEYLIRKYEIHERNVSEILESTLPFHDTQFFSKLISIMRVSAVPIFKWLLATSKAGAPLSRKTLVDAMSKDVAVLQFILDMAARAVDTKGDCRAVMTFYGVTVTTLLSSNPSVTTSLIRTLLPSIFRGVKSNNSDYRNATFMIVMELSIRCKFEEDVLDAILTAVTKQANESSAEQVVLLLITIFQHQTPKTIPSNSFKFLIKCPRLVALLKQYANKFDIEHLLKVSYL